MWTPDESLPYGLLNTQSPIVQNENSTSGNLRSVTYETSAAPPNIIDLSSEEDVLDTIRFSVEPLPQKLPYVREPQYVCNDMRERAPKFRQKLKEFQVYLAQYGHVSSWHRSEPFSFHYKEMLQKFVHYDGTHCPVSTMINLDDRFRGHNILWSIVRYFQYVCCNKL